MDQLGKDKSLSVSHHMVTYHWPLVGAALSCMPLHNGKYASIIVSVYATTVLYMACLDSCFLCFRKVGYLVDAPSLEGTSLTVCHGDAKRLEV